MEIMFASHLSPPKSDLENVDKSQTKTKNGINLVLQHCTENLKFYSQGTVREIIKQQL